MNTLSIWQIIIIIIIAFFHIWNRSNTSIRYLFIAMGSFISVIGFFSLTWLLFLLALPFGILIIFSLLGIGIATVVVSKNNENKYVIFNKILLYTAGIITFLLMVLFYHKISTIFMGSLLITGLISLYFLGGFMGLGIFNIQKKLTS